MSNLTVTNPANPSQTFVFGTKGRKPAWLTDGLAAGTITVPEGYVSAKDKAKSDKPAKATSNAVTDLEKRIAKLEETMEHAKNVHACAIRRVADAKAAIDGIQKEIDTTNRAIKVLQPVMPKGIAVTEIENPADAATDETPATEAVTETAELPAT